MAGKSFIEVYEAWRDAARAFSVDSIVQTALDVLAVKRQSRHEEVSHAPWLTLLIVKWVCQDQCTSGHRRITVAEFDGLRQALWEFPSHLEMGVRESLPVHLFLRQLIRPQIDFQRPGGMGFVREAALLAAQPANSKLRRLFEARTGLSVENYIDLAWLLYGTVKGSKPIEEWVAVANELYPDALPAFIETISLDLEGLKAFARSLPDAEKKVASELFEFPVLKRYPLLRTTNGALRCWHPVVLQRGLEGLVHAILSEDGQTYMQLFSKLFEKHVVDQAASLPGTFYGEADLREWLGPQSEVPDGLLSVQGINIFVESKSAMFDESVMTLGHAEIFRKRTESLAKAISQARAASGGIRAAARAPSHVRAAAKDFLLVVTNKEVSVGRGDRLATMYPAGALNALPSKSGLLSLERVYFLSIEDFERLVAGCREGGKQIAQVLEECERADSDAESRVFYFEQRLDALRFPRKVSGLVDRAGGDAQIRIFARAGLQEE